MPETYKELAILNNMSKLMRIKYLKYMKERWGSPEAEKLNCMCGYAQEWADRFLQGIAYQSSDIEGQAILRCIDNEMILSPEWEDLEE